MRKTMIKVLMLGFTSASVTGCANIAEMHSNVANQLRPDVGPVVVECEEALFSGSVDEAALIGLGLKKVTSGDGRIKFDNGLPKVTKSILTGKGFIGTGLRLEFKPSENKCSIAVGPDGFPGTVNTIVRAEMLSKGYVSDGRSGTYTKDGKTINITSRRTSGNSQTYYTTTASFTLN